MKLNSRERALNLINGDGSCGHAVINPTSIATAESCSALGFVFNETHLDADMMAALAAYGFENLARLPHPKKRHVDYQGLRCHGGTTSPSHLFKNCGMCRQFRQINSHYFVNCPLLFIRFSRFAQMTYFSV